MHSLDSNPRLIVSYSPPLYHLSYAASHQVSPGITYLNLVLTLTLTDLRFAATK